MTFELACCLLATAAALFYIFSPATFYLGPEKTRASYLRERKDAVYENLRDLNFEFKAGKMPDVRLPVAESFPARRSRHAPGRNRPPRSQSRHPPQEKRDHERNSNLASSLPLSS